MYNNFSNGLIEKEEAILLAQHFFEYYDRDKDDQLNQNDISFMDKDLNERLHSKSKSKTIKSNINVYDYNKDGKVTYKDIEELAIKYLVKNGPLMEIKKKEIKKEVVKKANLSKSAIQRLEVARRLFKMFDTDNSNNLGRSEVKLLLIETYKQMNMDSDIVEEDISSFMEMVDLDNDGNITIEDYEQYILQSLTSVGINVYEENIKI